MSRSEYSKVYSKIHYAEQKRRREALEAFRLANPERYAELMAQAKSEVESRIETPREVVRHSSTVASHLASHIELDLDKLLFHPNERHFHCLTSDGHLFLFTAPHNATLTTLSELTATYRARSGFGQLAKVARCDCPACRQRDIAEGLTPPDFSETDELLGEYFRGRGR